MLNLRIELADAESVEGSAPCGWNCTVTNAPSRRQSRSPRTSSRGGDGALCTSAPWNSDTDSSSWRATRVLSSVTHLYSSRRAPTTPFDSANNSPSSTRSRWRASGVDRESGAGFSTSSTPSWHPGLFATDGRDDRQFRRSAALRAPRAATGRDHPVPVRCETRRLRPCRPHQVFERAVPEDQRDTALQFFRRRLTALTTR